MPAQLIVDVSPQEPDHARMISALQASFEGTSIVLNLKRSPHLIGGYRPWLPLSPPFVLRLLKESGPFSQAVYLEEPSHPAIAQIQRAHQRQFGVIPTAVSYCFQNLNRTDLRFQWHVQGRRSATSVSAVFTASQLSQNLLSSWGLDRGKCPVVYWPVFVDTFPEHAPALNSHAPLSIVSGGRLVPEKGWRELLQGIGRFHREHLEKTVRFEWLGSGPDEASFDAMARELQSPRLTITRHKCSSSTELAERLAKAHLFIQHSLPTSRWVEQYGRLLVEALAAGTPALVTTGNAMMEVLESAGNACHEDVGFAFEAGTLARALDHWLQAPLPPLTLDARKKISSCFSMKNFLKQLKDTGFSLKDFHE